MQRSIRRISYIVLWIVLLTACSAPQRAQETALWDAYVDQVPPVSTDTGGASATSTMILPPTLTPVSPVPREEDAPTSAVIPRPTIADGSERSAGGLSREQAAPSPSEAVAPTTVSGAPPTPLAVQLAPEPTVVASLLPAAATPALPPRQAWRYVFPVQPASLTTYGSCHHDYPASDIFAPRGTQVVAVIDGQIEYVSDTDLWHPAEDGPATRGGLAIAMIGVDGVRYYHSHLDSIAGGLKPGAQVVAGQELGKVGTSGNARSTNPHLHFGISRPTTPDDWATRRGEINPVPYLQQWRTGGITFPPALTVAGDGACQPIDPADRHSETIPEPTGLPIAPPTTTSASPREAVPGRTRLAPTYRLRVTRQGMVGMTTANGHIIKPNDFFVSLPCRCALSRPGGPLYQVRLSANGRSVVVPVYDTGPYYTDDDFWEPQRRGHPDLPVGWPADHAAYYQNYQNREAELGYVRFPTAVDIGDGAYWALGLLGAQGVADVTFLWMGADPGPNPSPLPYGSY